MYSISRALGTAAFALLLCLPALSTASAEPDRDDPDYVPAYEFSEDWYNWWGPSYLVDYGLIAAGLTAFAVGDIMTPSSPSRIGPTYDPDDLSEVLQNDDIQEPYLLEDSVSTATMHGLIIGGGIGLAAMKAISWRRDDGSAQRFHDTVIGYVEALSLSAGITGMAKPIFSRLRPDFADRARRHHCDQEDNQYRTYCEGYANRPLHPSSSRADRRLKDGKRSFFSGHSSNGFSFFTYTALVLGGRYAWQPQASPRNRGLAIGAQTFLMGTATTIAASRVIDGRHHTSDVVTGSLLGFATANFAYWRRFDRQGHLRRGSGSDFRVGFDVTPSSGDAMLTLELTR